MAIGAYVRVIGRGRDGARSLTREQAADLFGQVLDGRASDLEIGAFCLAMRIKGETAAEFAGFLDATDARLRHLPDNGLTTVVLPSYNGARKLPNLTPLLALLLARAGAAVLVHGMPTEDARITSVDIFAELGHPTREHMPPHLHAGHCASVSTSALSPGLARLLDVRRAVGLRNSAHGVVKLMNPCAGRAFIIGSYTHAEYAETMAAALGMTGGHAMLLRGTEGEPVADPRRTPQIEVFCGGERRLVQAGRGGPLIAPPDLPRATSAAAIAAYTQAVLDGHLPVPEPIACQVAHILREVNRSSPLDSTLAATAEAP
ncbi:MAG: DNA-binding protein YbiB [Pseudomonadota bacterium]